MKYILFIIVIVLCQGMVSCGMQKNVQESRETYAHSSEISAETAVLEQNVKSIVRELLSEELERLTMQDMVSSREVYSEPDSSGRQYVVERTKTVINTSITEKQTGQRMTEQADSMTLDSRKIVKKETESDAAEFVTKEERRKPPWWRPALIMAVVVFVGLIIFKLLLRWR